MPGKTNTTIAATILALGATGAYAQATVKPDGQWRYALGAAASVSSGNSDSSSLTFNGEGVRATTADKINVYGRALRAETDGETTAEQVGLGGRYERNFGPRWYGFGQGDYLHDKPANLSSRLSAGVGAGYHLIVGETTTFDVFGGVGYTNDEFVDPAVVGGSLRDSYGRGELLLGEASTHRFSESTSFKQRLVLYPNLKDTGEYRAEFDAGLAVAMTKVMSLTVGLNYRYNSDPGEGLKKGDTLFLTGISVKID
jgi:putative salt-induced outer membrane protein YdiY